jgi:elongation factor Ts
MEITTQLVKTLRDKTKAGMMDCKKALLECEGDLEKSVDWLRQKGLMTARKRASRATKQGLIQTQVTPDAKIGAIVELNSETDFVAKMDSFKEIAQSIVSYLAAAASNPANVPADVPALLEAKCPTCGEAFGEVINRAVGTTGEAIRLRRFKVIQAGPNSLVHGYIHAGGLLAVLIEIEVEKPGPAAEELAHDLAMHVAAMNPMAIKVEQVSQDFWDKERAVHEAKSKDEIEKKNKNNLSKIGDLKTMLERMVEGKMKKTYTELVLLEQTFVKDPSKSVASLIKDASKKLGQIEIVSFARYQLGEELEGENEDENGSDE